MANWLQHLFLKPLHAKALGVAAFVATVPMAANASELNVNSELFDVSLVAGVINLEDFPAEYVIGANVTFKASEDFFLQYNYVQADVSKSSFEEADSSNVFAFDRSFSHYDLLLGYNLFQGEFFGAGDSAHLSALYTVGGIGYTDFGGEENFTYTIGVGYQIEFSRKYVLRLDYRDYIYQTSLIIGDEEKTVHNNQFSVGLGYLF
ncbi:MAG: outer membrane beta-barrel domain-containing protein [Agarilytica sp.]